ncbi:MAG: hypothetical protein M1482_01050 [Chloroflexi bacterium]|nr:hypothetical protein [Chloroflexota bacterium]
MPKKTRKMKQRAAERRTMLPGAPLESEPGEAPGSGDTPVRTRTEFMSARAPTPISYDYSHIYNDLKRIAMFAAFFFVVLIALSFVIK